jgi:hypothetical protein
MGMILNQQSYQRLVDEDLAWLAQQPRSLERAHIEDLLRWSVTALYATDCIPESLVCQKAIDASRQARARTPEAPNVR